LFDELKEEGGVRTGMSGEESVSLCRGVNGL
jgi:hypothetical protein